MVVAVIPRRVPAMSSVGRHRRVYQLLARFILQNVLCDAELADAGGNPSGKAHRCLLRISYWASGRSLWRVKRASLGPTGCPRASGAVSALEKLDVPGRSLQGPSRLTPPSSNQMENGDTYGTPLMALRTSYLATTVTGVWARNPASLSQLSLISGESTDPL